MPPIALTAVDQDVLPSRFTRFVNLMGLCALALPNGATAEGLPISLQIVCRGGEEAEAIRIGAALEAATEWHARRPTLPG
jgi:aspartyl-tRNA(Asn)/glutamyl-tRNA(Gln) amidotransferase subunit A